jgi:catechol 2,3-dioxygenase-like lactoylglutathione lyase family enzyme
MLNISKAFSSFSVNDIQKAKEFYGETLGLELSNGPEGTLVVPKRPVHLLGGRPDVQRRLAELMPVVSMDCNRFTLDAAYGDYFDGETFRPHPVGGYDRCLRDSIKNINKLWRGYTSGVGL